jgi:hypothetical protein
MTLTVEIRPLARSVYHAADEGAMRPFLDSLAARVAADANWRVRKKTLLDMIGEVEAATVQLHQASVRAGEAGVDPGEDPRRIFMETLPLYLAAILERVGEARIACIEQAAFYLLSAHPEHQSAAGDWIDGDPRNEKAFRRFLSANRRYRDLIERAPVTVRA